MPRFRGFEVRVTEHQPHDRTAHTVLSTVPSAFEVHSCCERAMQAALARAQDTFRREVTIGRRYAARLGAIVREDSTIWAAGYMRHVFHCASGHRLTVQLRCVTLREQDARHIL